MASPGGKRKRKATTSRTGAKSSASGKRPCTRKEKSTVSGLGRNPLPKASPQEDALARKLVEAGLGGFSRNFRFHETRKWMFDFAWPDLMVAMEFEGIGGKFSRHTSFKGYTGDCEKYSNASLLGWLLIRVTDPMLKGEEIGMRLIAEAIQQRREDYA